MLSFEFGLGGALQKLRMAYAVSDGARPAVEGAIPAPPFHPFHVRIGSPPKISLPQVERIACDPSWRRYAFVRNPYVRILSKFQDKIGRHSRDRTPGSHELIAIRAPARRVDGLNFTNFTARLAAVAEIEDELLSRHHSHHLRRKRSASKHPHAEPEYVDEHFRTMSSFCGMRHIPYEWIRYEELLAGMGKVVEQLGISKHPDIAAQMAKIRPHDDCAEAERLGAVFTDVDKQRIREYYAEDFKRFGYSDVFPTCRVSTRLVDRAAPETVAPIPAAKEAGGEGGLQRERHE
jgi:hypothetical protein